MVWVAEEAEAEVRQVTRLMVRRVADSPAGGYGFGGGAGGYGGGSSGGYGGGGFGGQGASLSSDALGALC